MVAGERAWFPQPHTVLAAQTRHSGLNSHLFRFHQLPDAPLIRASVQYAGNYAVQRKSRKCSASFPLNQLYFAS